MRQLHIFFIFILTFFFVSSAPLASDEMSSYSAFSAQQEEPKVTVVIDVFRAFSTASYVLDQFPESYVLATESRVISQLIKGIEDFLLIGKPEIGAEISYTIPNSPTRVLEEKVTGKKIFHRTAAGASGVLQAKDADIVLGVSFANVQATAHYIQRLNSPHVTIMPMGHEATTPSLEDNLCADYLKALLNNKDFSLETYLPFLREGSGKYFFGEDQVQYPQEDFERCLKVGQFDFVIQAHIKNNYALLTRIDK